MSDRRARERAERHQLIIRTARELAEQEGWDAVTTRRLSQLIGYSQPVLYSHFAGKDAIVTAVALQGVDELAAALRGAGSVAELVRAYTDFAFDHPVLYDAMFTLRTELEFGPNAPESLKQAFGLLYRVFAPQAGDQDPETFTEVAWSAMHGLVLLTRHSRLRDGLGEERVALLVTLLGRTP
ncbi:TetR/AcrR family transcriptional regulator [Amycolatopsis sp. 195334CR]|uniref:TetR/AcrR family transcriptional regulator n=1 Tax=Amycolatopsis sp. 195334CR TaxID=2814588 RepID=UPI001A8C5099|nr:TetR/AcrR family transcriptional regulator [Amycolatopsis sp. 195334CR]MBN6036822.1 helix-turn-helix transcriptional regulator [Amycolatopsis sp. 195334CR]